METRPSPYDVREGAPTSASPATLYVPYFAPDEPDLSGYYNNYLADGTTSTNWKVRQSRTEKYTAPIRSGVISGLGYLYGPNSGFEIQPLTRLTSNRGNLKTAISALSAGGDTNISAGVMWGWHVLSPNVPFKDGGPYRDADHDKIMIVMTDGQNHNVVAPNNNASIYSGIGYIWQNRLGINSGTLSTRIAKLDSKLSEACANAKAAGIVIYSVILEDKTVDQSSVRGCASSPDRVLEVSNPAGLQAAFDSIARMIQALTVSR